MAEEHRRPRLARPDPLPSTDGLPAEPMPPVPPGTPIQPPSRQVATDPQGAVRVALDAWGQAESVEISARWRDRLDPDGLVTALLETYWVATQQAVQAFSVARRAAKEAGQDPPDRARVRTTPELSPDPAVDRQAWLRWLQGRRASIHARRERRTRMVAATDHGPRERTGTHGLLTAIVQGRVTSITGDARKIWYARTEHLEQDALAILTPDNS